MKPFITALSFVLMASVTFGQTKFSKKQVLEDLANLYKTLEETHYNLYAYTPKEVFDTKYETLKERVVQDSLSILETTNLFQQLTSLANNGHTWIEFPISSYIAYAQEGGTVFPLELAFENDKALIRKNWSDTEIPIGSEILSINGNTIDQVLDSIYPQLSAERPYFKKAKIELYSFPRCYWQIFGQQDTFQVKIRTNETTKIHTIKAIAAIEDYEAKREEVINAQMKLDFKGTTAYLNPGGFGGDEENYRSFIDSAFASIKIKNSKHLIIDLRNNPGGDDAFSDYLVSYIANMPFLWTSRFRLKTSQQLKEHIRKNHDTTKTFWKKALAHNNGESYDYPFKAYQPQPAEKRFHGKVFALVNRQSHSQSTVTAAQLQDYGFATIVGEETAEYPSLFASIFQYPLPHTAIVVNISKGRIVRVNGSEKEEGVHPDIFIKDELLDKKDEILDGLLQKIPLL